MGDRGWVAREGTGFLIGKDRLVRTSMSNYIEGRIFLICYLELTLMVTIFALHE